MTYRKKLIEVALPLEAINAASVRESYIYRGNPTGIHKWWSGKPLAASRAVLFASLVDDPESPDISKEYFDACKALPLGKNSQISDTPRQRLFDFIERLIQWEALVDKEIIKTARNLIYLSTGKKTLAYLDPFAGGGSIPLEAQRLGLETYASDLNPVAAMINKALIEIPILFKDTAPVNPESNKMINARTNWRGTSGIASDINYYGKWVAEKAFECIGHSFPTGPNDEPVIAWLWARTVKSPNPAVNVHVPLVSKFALSTKDGERAWAQPLIDRQSGGIKFVVQTNEEKPPRGTVNRKGGRCLIGNTPIPFEYIRSEGQANRLGSQLMAIVTLSKAGRRYHSPTKRHEDASDVTIPVDAPDTDLPEHALGFRVQQYGMSKHKHLFTPRQLHAMVTFSNLIRDVRNEIVKDAIKASMSNENTPVNEGGTGARAYAETISTYLAFACDKYAMYGNSLVPWYTKENRPSMLFVQQTLSMVWDYVEVNPFSNIGGSFNRSVQIVAGCVENLTGEIPGNAKQADVSTEKLQSNVVISTDPPYYDYIGYSDLSDFFYIWMRRNIGELYPQLFDTLLVPKNAELVADPKRFGGRDEAHEHFESGLRKAFKNIRKSINSDIPLTIYYAFKQTERVKGENIQEQMIRNTGWETMLEGLVQSGFVISGTWPIRTERKGRMRDIGSNTLASSIVLVCRPRSEKTQKTSRRDFINILRRELPSALYEMQSGNIAPVDLAQASIGPGMAVYSRYSKVLEPDGSPLTVRNALQIINHELDAYLAEQEGEMDPDSRFAVSWFEQFGFDEGGFGQADVLARAKNTSVDGLAQAGVLESGAGKVCLLHWSKLDPGWDPESDSRLTVWETVHHLIERLNTYGEEGAARLLAKLSPEMASDARQLAYRLYSTCERKGWAEHARNYNTLVVSWGASQEQAREFKEQYQQGTMF